MQASVALLLSCLAGTTLAYDAWRQWPTALGPDDSSEPSQRLLWGNSGSNQVGGNDWWSMITNKFPFLRNKFGRMEAQSGVPSGSEIYAARSELAPHSFSQDVAPVGRDVAFTDDAVVITAPGASPVAPSSPGYAYRRPLTRLQLPDNWLL